jgi:hypothetical protein
MGDWMPSKELDKLQVLQTFSRGLVERAAALGVTQADAAEARRLVEALDAAVLVATSPATRTPVTVEAKRHALERAMSFCRRLAQFIKLNPNVSDDDRLSLGLPKAEAPREWRRAPVPETTPILGIRGIIPGGHEVEIFDSTAPDRRGKPADVRGLELVAAYSPNGADGALSRENIIRTGTPMGVLTRGMTRVIHPNERVGSVANYIGRWVNTRGEGGPWSQPLRMVLAIPGEGRLSAAA